MIENASSTPTNMEANFDGLIGPTHNFAGLAPGNLASQSHREDISHPQAAALQGLAKMEALRSLGIPQGVLPPQMRPNLDLLQRTGFGKDPAAALLRARDEAPWILASAMSGSSMWTANAATVSPSCDSNDGKVHFTPANLVTSLHRASETEFTARILKSVFPDHKHFVHHGALPASSDMGDEGAANHTRFCRQFGQSGIQFFVYGRDRRDRPINQSSRFVPRQTKDASEAVARLHRLDQDRVVFAKQHRSAIDAGVFHNDVIAVGHRDLLFCHELAFENSGAVYEKLRTASDNEIRIVEICERDLTLDDAVATYLFNSQIVTSGAGKTTLIAPAECQHNLGVRELLTKHIEEGTFDAVQFIDVRQSMKNGGGPACLRLRVELSADQLDSVARGVLMTDELSAQLSTWIRKHYRESLSSDDLADPSLMHEAYQALDELTQILGLGSMYDFQR